MKLIKNANVFTPEPIGNVDLLISDNRICRIEKNIDENNELIQEVIDGTGKYVVPGFIDGHEHIIGGGGEGGFSTRTPEAVLTDFTLNGITTVVGCIGTDGVTRNMKSLYAKAKGLEEEGISTFIYTGSYHIPVITATADLMTDIIMLDKVIGVGEIALSDHRSSQPTYEEFLRVVSDARIGGMLSGKAGIVNIHLGDSKRCMDLIEKVVAETEIPISQLWPTHVNRNAMLFEKALELAKKGGTIDFTANENIDYWETVSDEVRVSKGIKRMLEDNISTDLFTITSDGQGSFPMFDENGNYIGIGIGKARAILKEVKDCVLNYNIPLEIVLKGITTNPARVLKLKNKGKIEVGYDADLCLLDKNTLDINTVICKGKVMVSNGKPIVLGTFEQDIDTALKK
ncbi:beta-aspartyl-peptidase [Sedimentibacter sp. zth1]|uniref:beta-aspartyl-peptidase n=1 Tax=Sedimentibacter sp. zth1 TaxID=2816908 RepID=UPI001A92AB7E|nr:beta-aspartyl-peptidase [Sedimentibacter sp. zth1]QSX07296.1 beta-aspartyl-peptidase [Sedimentibacter sp. zth1]